MGQAAWDQVIGSTQAEPSPETVLERLSNRTDQLHSEWLPELARLELFRHHAGTTVIPAPLERTNICLNPSLQLFPTNWCNLLPLLTSAAEQTMTQVTSGEELILFWRNPDDGVVHGERALPEHLLAIKLMAEDISAEEAADQAGVTVAVIDALLSDCIQNGILLSPPSRLQRQTDQHAAQVFTLQWHLTQTCDLACKHCYDRSQRADFPFERALTLMQELRNFCRKRFVRPQVSFSGGNPLLHPRFFDLYQAAADHGLMIAILGNASDRPTLERILAIQRPVYYQVSLEGLEQHNDAIRGAGNYRRTIAFLRMLTKLGIPNLVMLTLTRANLDQVIPLAEQLEGITGGLAFNRLALFGEGANLVLPASDEYQTFLRQYVAALPTHPVLALKDSLLNCIFEEQDRTLFGGCAGFGCGAAFNFLAVLSDGEVHACRKLPSPLGTILQQSLEDIYDSRLAARYRAGSSACNDCNLRAVCGGCLAVTASLGLDPLTNRDPYCVKQTSQPLT